MSHTPTELLMGAKLGQMNLQAVKARAEEIRKTLDNLLQTLRFAPASLQWYMIRIQESAATTFTNFTGQQLYSKHHPFLTLVFPLLSIYRSDALDKFAVLNIQLQHLSAQLRPLLQHYAIHPKSVNQTNAPILPIMLATKLLPEQEEEQEAMLDDGRALSDAQACLKATSELSALVDSIIQNGGPLDPKGPSRIKLAASVKAATIKEQDKRTESAQGMARSGPLVGSGIDRRQQIQPPAPLQGDQLLLAAASYGAGL